MRLSSLHTQDLDGGINLIDIGASGPGDPRWTPIAPLLNLIGFDPNTEECDRLNAEPTPYNRANFLPYAIAEREGEHTLYRTKNKYCFSLLEPDADWLNRFSYGELFDVVGTETVTARPLAAVPELSTVDVDAIKIDAQGIELKILQSSGDVLQQAFYVETESGFVSNYKGESTQAEVDQFMRDAGFLMFDINTDHRITRANAFAKGVETRAQPLWCEVVWLKDYIRLGTEGLTQAKALKALLLCAAHGFLDYGLELAQRFQEDGLIEADLSSEEAWVLPREAEPETLPSSFAARAICGLLCLLPWKLRQNVKIEFNRVAEGPNTLKKFGQ